MNDRVELWAVVSIRGPERFFASSREAYEFLAAQHVNAPREKDEYSACGYDRGWLYEPECYPPDSFTVEEYVAEKKR